ncbi:hypothetical protein HIM_04193 [Hirsutella minnesotensis 3608]|uniref:Uncharacterized protein n=1 Tax=Hirsutella minnesotensis 3608 TaxID=1043627 RepID=A0A0F8A650_9HYPO|nr:hypothetical protein HIM_04193 [Hirsutella minnesotensis 3608]
MESHERDRASILKTITWFLCITEICSVGTRLMTRYYMTRKVAWDDRLIIIAQIASIARCVATSVGATKGMGNSIDTLKNESVDSILKVEYAIAPLLLLTLAFVKWSTSAFLKQITPSTIHRRQAIAFDVVVGAWLISATLVSLFQCPLPYPWDYIHGAQCINRRAWWTYAAVLNMVTDVYMAGLLSSVCVILQMRLRQRILLISVFSSKLVAVGVTAAQLAVFLDMYSINNISNSLWLPVMLNQAVSCVSIMTASVPYLKPFMDSLDAGIIQVGNLRVSEEDLSASWAGSNEYAMSNPPSFSSAYLRSPVAISSFRLRQPAVRQYIEMASLQAPSRHVVEALCREKGPKFNGLAYDDHIWIKYDTGVTLAEAAIQRYVYEHADARIVRIPQVLDAFCSETSYGCPMTCIVMERIKGDDYATHIRQHPQEAEQILDAIAQAVRHIWDIPIPPDSQPGPLERQEPRDRFFSETGSERVFDNLFELESWINGKLEEARYQDRISLQGETLQICHGDLTQFNFKVGEPVALLDWEFSGIYPRAFEEFALVHQFNLHGQKFAKALHQRLFGPKISKPIRALSLAARFLAFGC